MLVHLLGIDINVEPTWDVFPTSLKTQTNMPYTVLQNKDPIFKRNLLYLKDCVIACVSA